MKFYVPGERLFYFSSEKNEIFSLISTVKLSKHLRSSEIVFLVKLEVLNKDAVEIVELINIPMVFNFAYVS